MISSVRLVRIRRTRPDQFTAKMAPMGEDPRNSDPTEFVGEQLRERFGPGLPYGRFLVNDDLKPELQNEHHGNARYVAQQMHKGDEGTFEVNPRGQFVDYHGSFGLPYADAAEWFTMPALDRGIGWHFVQTYLHENRPVARFRVIRMFTSRGGGRLMIYKRKLR